MLDRFEEYKEFVTKITNIYPIMRTEQMKMMISRCFGQSIESTDEVLFAMKTSSILILSVDGWCMSLGEYRKLTGDYFLTKCSSEDDEYRRAPEVEGKLKYINRDVVDSLWLVADMMPKSENFILTNPPWTISFCTKAEANKSPLLYQITVIRKGEEYIKSEMLKTLPKITNDHIKESIRRIAILEDDSYAFMIPKVGFSHIVCIDENTPSKYKIVEKRTNVVDRWNDED